MVRIILISVATIVALACMLLIVIVLGLVLPVGFVDHGLDEYEGRKQRAVIESIGEMYERKQDGLGTRRVTTWRITSVEKCATGRPHPYAVELELYTIFGIPSGVTGLSCRE